jgi:hypothetical protein
MFKMCKIGCKVIREEGVLKKKTKGNILTERQPQITLKVNIPVYLFTFKNLNEIKILGSKKKK